jgi:DNA modification methylase
MRDFHAQKEYLKTHSHGRENNSESKSENSNTNSNLNSLGGSSGIYGLADLVTFVPNKEEPIHNWFYYKEGYAKRLIKWLVDKYSLEGPVLDPFCGVGTTLLASKELGLESIGLDVSPLPSFIARVKTRDYNIEELEKALDEIATLRPECIGKYSNKHIRKLFREENLNDIYFYHTKIMELKDEKIKEFLLLALIDTTGRVANVIKTGGSLRKTKKPFMPVKKLFLGKAKKMIIDIRKHAPKGPEPVILKDDARTFDIGKEKVNCIITSPPYLNKIEYTSIYKIELGLFFGEPETRLRAFISDSPDNITAKENELPIETAYFEDMKKVLERMYFALKKGGKAIIVVAGGCLPEKVVESDDRLIEMSKEIGFKLIEKIVARQIDCMSMRTDKLGKVNESIIVLEK